MRPVRRGLEFEAHMEIAQLEAYKAAMVRKRGSGTPCPFRWEVP